MNHTNCTESLVCSLQPCNSLDMYFSCIPGYSFVLLPLQVSGSLAGGRHRSWIKVCGEGVSVGCVVVRRGEGGGS